MSEAVRKAMGSTPPPVVREALDRGQWTKLALEDQVILGKLSDWGIWPDDHVPPAGSDLGEGFASQVGPGEAVEDNEVFWLLREIAFAAFAAGRDVGLREALKDDPRAGARMVVEERMRQIYDEGYDAAHDAGHAAELRDAAIGYLSYLHSLDQGVVATVDELAVPWPWHPSYFKPVITSEVRTLVKAGALVSAAIDSLLAAQKAGS